MMGKLLGYIDVEIGSQEECQMTRYQEGQSSDVSTMIALLTCSPVTSPRVTWRLEAGFKTLVIPTNSHLVVMLCVKQRRLPE